MAEQILSMAELKNKALGLDRAEMWDVYATNEQDRHGCPKHMEVYNVTQKDQACIARKSYCVIQHKHAIESLVEAITALNIKSEATLKTGKHSMQVDINFPDSFVELTSVGEKFTSGIRLESNYAEVAGLKISPRVTRMACSNGMIVTEIVKSVRIRWTEQLNIELQGIIDTIIKDIISGDEKLSEYVSVCMKDSVEWQTTLLLTKHLFRQKKHVKEILGRIEKNSDGKVSRWSYYNAITSYATKGQRIKPQLDSWLQNKAQEVLKTPFALLTENIVKSAAGKNEV